MKYLSVDYVNQCIKNVILSTERCDKEANPLVYGDIFCSYFDLTNTQMLDKQVKYIETLNHKQAWAIMKCLRSLLNK